MTVLEAFFVYIGSALLIAQAFFAVPFLGLYIAMSFFRPDMELSPQDL